MATYESTVLSKSPFYFARLKELSGTSIADISGNNYPGTYFNDAGFGHSSPIETDAGDTAIGGRCGIVTAPAPTAAWSIGGWVFAEAGVDAAIVNRNGQFLVSGSNFVAWDAGAGRIRGFVSNSAAEVEVSYTVPTLNRWYRVLMTRNMNVVRLHVNGLLRDEDTGFSVAAMDGTWASIGTWKLGCNGDSGNLANLGAAIDEIDLYDHQLSASDELEIYESALAVLPLSATIYVRFGVELDTDQVLPIDFPFTHNFADAISGQPTPLIEVLQKVTNQNLSEPDYRQRVNAQPYHWQRMYEYQVTSVGRQRAMLQASLWTPGDVYKLPIADDWGKLTAQANPGASTLSLDTILKDYEVDSYVTVWGNIFDASTAQTFQITSVSDTQLGISPNVGTALPIDSPVMPARLACLPEEDLKVESHLIDRETAVLQFEVLSTELSTRRITAYTPAQTYKSLEIFSLEKAKVEWVDPTSYQLGRRMAGTGNPTGSDYQRPIDTGSPQTIPLRVTLNTRAALAEFRGWMDARQGAQNPVWICSNENDLPKISRNYAITATYIDVEYTGYAERYKLHSARRHIGFVQADGSIVPRKIVEAVNNGDGTETLRIADANGSGVGETIGSTEFDGAVKISFLKLCTAPDRFELHYHRNGTGFIAECEFVMIELLTTPE